MIRPQTVDGVFINGSEYIFSVKVEDVKIMDHITNGNLESTPSYPFFETLYEIRVLEGRNFHLLLWTIL